MSPHHKRCGIILHHPVTGKYLLVRGIDSRKWGFPKGHMEWGEVEEETAIREFEEETGLTVDAPFDNRLRFGNNIYFVKSHCEERQPVIRDTKEIDEVQWFTRPEILALPKDRCNFGLSMWRKHVMNNHHHPLTSRKTEDKRTTGTSISNWFHRISVPVFSKECAKPSKQDHNNNNNNNILGIDSRCIPVHL